MWTLLIRVEVLADNSKVIWWNLILVVLPAIPVCPWVHLWNLSWIPETKDLIWTHLQLIPIDNVFLLHFSFVWNVTLEKKDSGCELDLCI